MSELSQDLQKIVYNTDASGIDLDADLEFAQPESIDDIRSILQNAIDQDKVIIPRGAWTSLVGGVLPDRDNCIVLDMSGLDNIYDLDQNGNITVETWVVLDDLNKFLSDEDRYFPVQIGSHRVAQLWAMMASSAAGMRATKYSSMGNWVNRAQVAMIDEDDNIHIKKIQWEELKEFVGSEGRFGLVLKLNLSTIDELANKSICFKKFDSIDKLLEKIPKIQKQSTTLAIELIGRQTSRFLGLEDKYHLIVEHKWDKWAITDPSEIKKIWDYRDSCYCVLAERGYKYIEDPQLGLDDISELVEYLEKYDIPFFGHIGIGLLHPHFKELDDKVDDMYNLVKKLDGKISGEHGIGIKKLKYLDDKDLEYIQKFKDKYDPNDYFGVGVST